MTQQSHSYGICPEERRSEVAQSCLTLYVPMDCSLQGSFVNGIFKARVLEWVAISFSRRSSPPRDQTWVSCIAGRHFTIWATREAPYPEETRVEKDTCTPLFTAALFTIARIWKQPRCPLTDEWIEKLWYIYTMKYYSAIKRNTFDSVLMR